MNQANSNNNRRDFMMKAALAAAGIALSKFSRAGEAYQAQENQSKSKSKTMKSNITTKRKPGNPDVSAPGLGCMNMTWAYGSAVDKQSSN